MRSEKEMMDLILNTAREDERIRAVIMNGSRVNPNVKKDIFQDYDIVYIVKDIESFTCNHNWVKRFGEIMIMQMPEEMTLLAPDKDGKFVYLMQFTDGNRIDLTLVPVERADEFIYNDSLSVLLLDKDGVVKPFPPASDKDYIIKKPSKKEFDDCCNEFWWVCPYVAKGIWREELPYAKHILEQNLRAMLMKILEWDIGIRTNFTKSAGKFGKYFEKYLDADTWKEFLETYSDADYENVWKSLFVMCNLFRKTAIRVADYFGFQYPYGDDERVTVHLKHVKDLPKDAEKMY